MISTSVQHEYLTVDGLHIHYLVAGNEGPPVILLHGGGLDSASLSWEEIVGPLARNYRVFAPDLPGYGLSDKPSIQYTISYYTTFIEKFIQALDIQQVSLGGLSLGGAITLSLALHRPDLIKNLILVDTYGIQDKVAAHTLSYLYIQVPLLNEFSYWLTKKSRSFIRWTLLASLIYDPQRLSNDLLEKVIQAIHDPYAGKAFMTTQRHDVAWDHIRTNFTARLREIEAPTLIIHGSHDSAVPLNYAQRAHSLLKNSQLSIMQECRHWPQREKPEEFIRIVQDFLDSHP